MGPWVWSAAMRPDSWVESQTNLTHLATFSPYLPRPGRLPADMKARPARPVMPAAEALRLKAPSGCWDLESQSRPRETASFCLSVISSPRTWLGLSATPAVLGLGL